MAERLYRSLAFAVVMAISACQSSDDDRWFSSGGNSAGPPPLEWGVKPSNRGAGESWDSYRGTTPATLRVPSFEENKITVTVLHAERQPAPYLGWHLDIQVLVEGRGPAFGYYDSTSLYLTGSVMPRDHSSLWNLNSEGWPMEYRVVGTYSDTSDVSGEVLVEVTAADVAHDSYGRTMLRERIELTWPE